MFYDLKALENVTHIKYNCSYKYGQAKAIVLLDRVVELL